MVLFHYYIVLKNLQSKAARERLTPRQSKNLISRITTHRERENKKVASSLGNKSLALLLNPLTLVPLHGTQSRQDHSRENLRGISPVALRGSAARRRITLLMSNQSTACNPYWHKQHMQSTPVRATGYRPS